MEPSYQQGEVWRCLFGDGSHSKQEDREEEEKEEEEEEDRR